jgi:hypothetical protein
MMQKIPISKTYYKITNKKKKKLKKGQFKSLIIKYL